MEFSGMVGASLPQAVASCPLLTRCNHLYHLYHSLCARVGSDVGGEAHASSKSPHYNDTTTLRSTM